MTTSRTPRRRGRVLAAALVAALALTGCAGGAEPEDSSPSAEGGPADVELVLAARTPPNSLDPAQIIDGEQGYIWGSIFDTLLVMDYETGEISPNLAESWEYNEDGTELTLKLRSDATFSDGDPVDANAVVQTMQRTKDTAGLVQPKLQYVESISAPDAETVVIGFSRFDPRFTYLLTQVLGVVGDPETLDDARTATDPIGSGPYVLDTAASVAGDTYVLNKRDDYWAADEYPYETVRVRVIQDSSASLNALITGEVNAATVRAQVLGQLDSNSFTLTEQKAKSLVALNILDRGGEQWPALGDVRVRQAINMALDRDGLVQGIAGGFGEGTVQTFRPGGPINDPALNERYPYDPEEAKALVEEAGYEGETFRIPSTFLTTPYEAALTGAFEAIGLGLEWVPVPPQQVQSVLTSGEYGLYVQVPAVKNPAMDTIDWFAPNGFANPRGYTDATMDDLFTQLYETVELEDAVPIYRELNEYVVDQAFIAPISFGTATWATADGVTVRDDGSTGAFPSVRQFGFEK